MNISQYEFGRRREQLMVFQKALITQRTQATATCTIAYLISNLESNMASSKPLIWAMLLTNLTCFLLLWTLLVHPTRVGKLRKHCKSAYTHSRYDIRTKTTAYKGHDFPDTLPVSSLGRALMTVEESPKYPLQGIKSDNEWFSMTSAGYGYVHLGPNNRIFAVTMFHEVRSNLPHTVRKNSR
jgi:hypothetical protein